MKIALIGALLLAVPASADVPKPTFADAIGICRAGLAEAVTGGDGSRYRALIEALPDDSRPLALVVCTAYQIGGEDRIALLSSGARPARAI